MVKKEVSKVNYSTIPASFKRKMLDLEVEIAKLKIELKFYKRELELCKEETYVRSEKK